MSSNDAMALGAIRAGVDLGIIIPNDLKVIVYDNIVFGKHSVPRLSTINQFKRRSGDLIIDELEKVSKNGKKPQKYEVTPEIVVRESTKRSR